MTEAAGDEAAPGAVAEATPAPARTRRARWSSIVAKTLLSLTAGALIMLAAVGLLLDTDLGHRLIIDRVAAMTPPSGLRIRIGRIEGSIWGRTELRDVRLSDPEGLFAEAPKMSLQWQPFAWVWGRLVVDEISSDLAIVHRLPRFEPEAARGLPASDFHVGRFALAQLRFEPAVTGTRRTARISGEAEFRSGRFLLDLDAAMRGGGDRIDMLIDAAPDRDQLELAMTLDAPRDGVLVRMLGARAPLRAEVNGQGSWSRWDGRARITIDGQDGGTLGLAARSGRYGAAGWIAPAALLGPRLAALAAGRVDVRGEGRLIEGVLDGRLSARSAAAQLALQGKADLRANAWDDMRAGLMLLRPAPLVAGVTASAGTRATLILDGPFADAGFAYRVAVPRLELGETAFEAVQASGSGRRAGDRTILPIVASARGASGRGGQYLADVRLTGTLHGDGPRVTGDRLALTSDRLRATFSLASDGGRTLLNGNAASDGFAFAGLGTVDLAGDWRAVSEGAGFRLSGNAHGLVRRFDNEALAWAAGGPLRIEAALAAGADGALTLSNLRLAAPRLQLSGSAARRGDGAISAQANGRQAALGPLALTYEGERLSLRLARPAASLGLADVRVDVEPASRGFGYRASGRSPLGPFAARGTVVPGTGGLAAVRVAALSVSGASASGTLRAGGGGVSGRLDFRGALSGPLTLAAAGGGQRIDAAFVATDARLGRVPIGSGRIAASVEVGGAGGLSGTMRLDGAADRLWAAAGVDGAQLSGPFTLDGALGGTISAPSVSGPFRLENGRFTSSSAGSRIDDLDVRGRLDGQRVVIEALRGTAGSGGRISGSGTIGLDGDVDVAIEADDALLLARPDARARVSGPIRISFDGSGGTISGELRLSDAQVRIGSSGPGAGGNGGTAWRLALRVEAERVGVEGRGLDSRWRAALRVGGTTAAPSILGEATLIDGTYRVLGRPFELSRGTMRFDGSADPLLDIFARPPGGGLAVHIGGRASRPELGLGNPLSSQRRDGPTAPAPRQAAGIAPAARRGRRRSAAQLL